MSDNMPREMRVFQLKIWYWNCSN